ncbi:hypothetical protein F5Y05DRAFT_422004 [Hypoxylon sp. FL0543]|nr:hypothetical protein F5Y05DRAFT_422004 [Hypoxylon sp. FL0543]
MTTMSSAANSGLLREASGAAAEGTATGSAGRQLSANQGEGTTRTNTGRSNHAGRPRLPFLTTTGLFSPRPTLISSYQGPSSSQVNHNLTASSINNLSASKSYSCSSAARKGKGLAMGTSPSLPWGVRRAQVKLPRSTQLDDTFLAVGSPERKGGQEPRLPHQAQQQLECQTRGMLEKSKGATRHAGILPSLSEVTSVQSILYAIIAVALANAIASVTVLNRAAVVPGDELMAIRLWAVASVAILVVVLAYNNHRDAQTQESGGARRQHDRRWIELGDLHALRQKLPSSTFSRPRPPPAAHLRHLPHKASKTRAPRKETAGPNEENPE